MKRIAVIPGDGIGVEVTAEVVKALKRFKGEGLALDLQLFDFGAERFLKTGVALPPGAMEELAAFDAIFLGAIGDPRIRDSAHAREIILGMRFQLDLYVNERPVRLLEERFTPLKGRRPQDIDLVVLRENTEDSYIGAGGFFKKGTQDEVAMEGSLATRKGVERILRYAFEFARRRDGRRLLMSDKHNALRFTSDLWHRTFVELREHYPDVEARHLFADNLCLQLVKDPAQFDVIVTANLFGDLVSDLTAALAGGLGLAPSASYNPQTGKALFEPVHGSANDIAGRELANPMAALLSAAMMLDFIGHAEWGARLRKAVHECVADGLTTVDLGGTLGTRAVGDAVCERL